MRKISKMQKKVTPAQRSCQITNKCDAPTQPTPLVKVGGAIELQKAKDEANQRAQAMAILAQASGVKETRLGAHIVDQVSRTLASLPSGDATEDLKVAVELMQAIKPEGVMEAMLATQMVGVHHAALSALERAALQTKSAEDLEAATRVYARLMRVYLEQLEAMAKLKGKSGQQKITVEHVDVHAGGQAIVGSVSAAPHREGEGGNEKTPK